MHEKQKGTNEEKIMPIDGRSRCLLCIDDDANVYDFVIGTKKQWKTQKQVARFMFTLNSVIIFQ